MNTGIFLATRVYPAVLIVLMALVSHVVVAQPIAPPKAVSESTQAVPEPVMQTIYARLRSARPDLEPSEIRQSPVSGLYQVLLNGQPAFVSEDGGFLIAGEMYQVNVGHLVNLQEKQRQEQDKLFQPKRAKLLAAVPKDDMVIYTPKQETKGHIYVFTDIDCGYCRRLHAQMDEMLEKGIEVRYLAFPRAGIPSRSAEKLSTVWCSKTPLDTMTDFKTGKNVAMNSCDNHPVADHYMLGKDIGVTGTPAIVLESGQLIPGAVRTSMLVKEMGI